MAFSNSFRYDAFYSLVLLILGNSFTFICTKKTLTDLLKYWEILFPFFIPFTIFFFKVNRFLVIVFLLSLYYFKILTQIIIYQLENYVIIWKVLLQIRHTLLLLYLKTKYIFLYLFILYIHLQNNFIYIFYKTRSLFLMFQHQPVNLQIS